MVNINFLVVCYILKRIMSIYIIRSAPLGDRSTPEQSCPAREICLPSVLLETLGLSCGNPSEDGGVKQDTTALEWFEWSFSLAGHESSDSTLQYKILR